MRAAYADVDGCQWRVCQRQHRGHERAESRACCWQLPRRWLAAPRCRRPCRRARTCAAGAMCNVLAPQSGLGIGCTPSGAGVDGRAAHHATSVTSRWPKICPAAASAEVYPERRAAVAWRWREVRGGGEGEVGTAHATAFAGSCSPASQDDSAAPRQPGGARGVGKAMSRAPCTWSCSCASQRAAPRRRRPWRQADRGRCCTQPEAIVHGDNNDPASRSTDRDQAEQVPSQDSSLPVRKAKRKGSCWEELLIRRGRPTPSRVPAQASSTLGPPRGLEAP